MATLRSTLIANILIVVIGWATVTGQRTHEPTVESCYRISDHEQRCFKALRSSGSLITWPEARNWCYNQSGGYVLATVRDDATQEALITFLNDNELLSRSVWLGAKQTFNSRWIWLDGTTEQDTNVQGSTYSNRSVAVLVGSKLMSSSMSPYRQRYICQFEGEKCRKFAKDSSRYRDGRNNNCYVTFPRINQEALLPWYKARTFCLHHGGDLARSRAVLDVTSSSWPGSHKYYVGLLKDEYVWIDTKEIVGPYNNFQGGQTSWTNQEKCVLLSYYPNFRVWEVNRCDHPRFFVCSTVKPVSGTIEPVTTSVNGTRTTAAATNELLLPAVSLLAAIGISVGAFVFFVVCIIITAVVTCACVRGSSSKASGSHARPNDYERETADAQNKKSQKKIQKREKKNQKREEKNQKKNQTKNRNEDEADQDIGSQEPPDFSGHDPIGYEGDEFQDTNTNPYPYPYDPADEQYYPSESVYNNDPQFQPPVTGYVDEYQNH